ncbi:hypothetical protein ONZ45_g18503 [Pleurotus djamor]|nr:hypothetical protein ONZ45_g18503 [Pleurotus djamor]
MFRSSELRITGKKFTLVGTPEGREVKDPSQMDTLPDLINDLDVDLTDAALKAYNKDRRNARKIREATSKLQVNIIFPLRPGKRLLVLDIDYTILDTKPLTSGSLPPNECARPKLHEFLETIYPYYDICIWSQTSWIWLETKLVELQMVGANRNYHISFDKTCMFTVFTERDNKPWSHSVKALQIIWNRFPQFNASNTIHIDDLSRNFALNPGSGLKIAAFKNAHTPAAMADRELEKLARYMVHIASVPDFRTLRHKQAKPPALPRPSASVVVINERNEILLVQRNPQARHFGGVTVFPGGNYDKQEDSSLEITAIRETFEESGLLLARSASGTTPTDAILDEARFAIHSRKASFNTFLQKHNLEADVSALLPFTQWITPVGPPRRFHTQFYATFLPATSASGFSSGNKHERIPKPVIITLTNPPSLPPLHITYPDGGQEVISARFIHPETALSENREGKITFMPPQFYVITTLAGILRGSTNTAAQRELVRQLSQGMFGRMVINPRRMADPDEEGRAILTYEGDETRGGSKGRLHRALVKLDKAGILTHEIVLQRNFDVFTEIEPQAFKTPPLPGPKL